MHVLVIWINCRHETPDIIAILEVLAEKVQRVTEQVENKRRGYLNN